MSNDDTNTVHCPTPAPSVEPASLRRATSNATLSPTRYALILFLHGGAIEAFLAQW